MSAAERQEEAPGGEGELLFFEWAPCHGGFENKDRSRVRDTGREAQLPLLVERHRTVEDEVFQFDVAVCRDVAAIEPARDEAAGSVNGQLGRGTPPTDFVAGKVSGHGFVDESFDRFFVRSLVLQFILSGEDVDQRQLELTDALTLLLDQGVLGRETLSGAVAFLFQTIDALPRGLSATG